MRAEARQVSELCGAHSAELYSFVLKKQNILMCEYVNDYVFFLWRWGCLEE